MEVEETKPVEPAKKVRRQQSGADKDNLLAIAAIKSRQIYLPEGDGAGRYCRFSRFRSG